jgi:hypothetical protein
MAPGEPIECLAAIAWEAKKPLDVTKVCCGCRHDGGRRTCAAAARDPLHQLAQLACR